MLSSFTRAASLLFVLLASTGVTALVHAARALPDYCSIAPSTQVDLILITNEGICLNSTEIGVICGPQMTKVALKCSHGANSGFGYRLSSYGKYGMASNQTLVGKEKFCAANGMPPSREVQPILEFVLDKEGGPMFNPHNTGAMTLMCGYGPTSS